MQPIPRRDFVLVAASTAASLALAPAALARAGRRQDRAAKPLRILILGGTGFLGPETVEAAEARGHTVTLFNRGKTRPDLFPKLEKLRGDRDPNKGEGLKALEGRSWDVVIDNSGYYPRMVKASAELLAPNVGQYIFVSSISAFKEGATANSDESWPVATVADPSVEEMGKQFENYGGFKAMCEQAAEAALPGRTTNIRPGFIVGPGDRSGRFNYWPLRAREGGEMLGPGSTSDPVQWIDVRDLAAWIVKCAEDKAIGVYIATGPQPPGTIGQVVGESVRVAQAEGARASDPSGPFAGAASTTVTWVPADFLEAQGVSAGGDLPIWIPPKGEHSGFHRWNVSKAIGAGLTFRPLDDTIRGIYAWYDALPADDRKRFRAGMTREREAEVLKAWHERAKS